jgi:hypothetical protein
MSTLVQAMLPAIFFWTLPLTPAFYALIMGTIELVTKPAQGQRERSSSRAAGPVHASAFAPRRQTAAQTEASG